MKNLHKIGMSKEPTQDIVRRMVENLRLLSGRASCIELVRWDHRGSKYWKYQLDIVGNTGVDHHISIKNDWPVFLEKYRELVKKLKKGDKSP